MVIVYFFFLGLYRLTYKASSCIRNIRFIIYKDSNISLWYQSKFFEFFSLLLRSKHYSYRITYFFDEHHRLLLISYLCQPKTEVTGHSEVDLVETITTVCSRSSKKLSRVA